MIKGLLGWLFLVGTAFFCSGPTIFPNASSFATVVLIEGAWLLSLYFTRFIPLVTLITGGLLADFLLPDPPGFLFLVLLLGYCTIDFLRKRFAEWGLVFWGTTFGAMFAFDMFLLWILSSVQSWRILDLKTFLYMWIIGMVVYIPLHIFFAKLKQDEVENNRDL